jgi:hypothetical protein
MKERRPERAEPMAEERRFYCYSHHNHHLAASTFGGIAYQFFGHEGRPTILMVLWNSCKSNDQLCNLTQDQHYLLLEYHQTLIDH